MTIETKAREWAERKYPIDEKRVDTNHVHKLIEKRMIAQSAFIAAMQKANKWIDITHRKPEFGIGVLVHVSNGVITVAYFTKKKGEPIQCHLFGPAEDTLCIDLKHDSITHWMPLPHHPEK